MNNQQKLFFIGLMLLSIFMVARPAHAAGGVDSAWTASQTELTVGDPVQLTLEVNHPADTQVIIPRLEQQWGRFEVRQQSPVETVIGDDGRAATRQTVTVTLFEPGNFETPPLPLTVIDGQGQSHQAAVAPLSLTVRPTLAEGDTTLMDIRPQAGLDLPRPWPAAAAGLVAVVAVAGGGWWLYRRWRHTGGLMADNRLPWQVALDELARIERLRLPEKGHFKEHYTLVTDALRAYLEQQFNVSATDRTTTELKQELGYSSLTQEQVRSLIELFYEADLVKFAKFTPEPAEAGQFTAEARLRVETTHPRPAASTPESHTNPVEPAKLPQPMEVSR